MSSAVAIVVPLSTPAQQVQETIVIAQSEWQMQVTAQITANGSFNLRAPDCAGLRPDLTGENFAKNPAKNFAPGPCKPFFVGQNFYAGGA